VRDLSNELNKKIELEMIGAETELDRQVSEIIRDPLTHMVRNSGDHGIEIPSERVAAGKPETGTIKLEAYHEGGHVIIKITDDGKGINVARVREKSVSNGLLTEAEMEAMSDQQILQYIFRPGFSTAEKVTSVSGRGVGMDVVKTNIEKIGGTVDLQSTVGKGSIFTIKIPLTLAIVSSLIVGAGNQRFAIPQISVVELVTPDESGNARIDHIQDTPVLRLRNRLYPLVSLKSMLKLKTQSDPDAQEVIVVVQAGAYVYGIIVDQVYDQEEIVVKPVSPILRNIPVFSGNTVLGDGSVVMILDPNGVAATTGEVSSADNSAAQTEQEKRARARGNDQQSFLLFKAGNGAPHAVPLALIARLEDISMDQLEKSSDHFVTQYRGKLMPLIPLPGVEFDVTNKKQTRPVLVFSDRDRSMGMIVDEIVDIVDEELDIQLLSDGKGLLGSAVLDGKSTDLIDVSYYLTQAFRDWFGSADKATASSEGNSKHRKRRVLLVDDSQFFRNMLTPLLTMSGYDVTTVNNAEEALAVCETENFDAIVSDIEMPGMNGFDFAEQLRKMDKWKATPMVALSAHSSAADLARGRDVGFDDYVPKYDREALLQTLQQTFSTGVAA
jgi:two-component system chemotaxis sensor kinase CheA